MDELKIIFWIVIGLVYLFARRRKKPQEFPAEQRSPESEEERRIPEPTKPLSFEELLSEIQGMKKEETVAEPSPGDSGSGTRSRREWQYAGEVGEKKTLEGAAYDYREHDKIYQVYEDAKSLAFHRPSLEETVKLQDTIVRFKQFKVYETGTKRNLAAEYFKELKEPQGFKKALILSEILRKRF